MEENNILVSICCETYNHQSFIDQCIEGFLMQKTNFKFEILIHDDASTDDTANIIKGYEKKYPHLIKPIYQQENQHSKKDVYMWADIQFPRAKGKYIAICEGDDYWTDPYKLQKQVDFLENNPDYSVCSHRFQKYYEAENHYESDKFQNIIQFDKEGGFTFDNNFNINHIWLTLTVTLMFRKNAFDFSILKSYKYSRDFHLCYYLLKSGKGYFMNYVAAVYRQHIGGIYSSTSEIDRRNIHYRMARELYYNNLEDSSIEKYFQQYKSFFFEYIQLSFYDRTYSLKLLHDLCEYLHDEYAYSGIKTCLKSLREIGLSIRRSITKEFFNRYRQSKN